MHAEIDLAIQVINKEIKVHPCTVMLVLSSPLTAFAEKSKFWFSPVENGLEK